MLIVSWIFYLRFPNNYLNPNFYAEDGVVFARNIIDGGFLDAIGTSFNGYYIWGIYILTKVGFIFNYLFLGNEFVNLARSFAIVSYLFLGFVATLPVLLFKKYFPPIALVFIVLLSTFVPMASYDYAIIGTIGNLKFAFTYIAFLLLIYRHLMPEKSKKVYLIDIALLICAYTNITVYVLMPFALLRYFPKRHTLKELRHDQTFVSLIGLGILLLPQLYVIQHYGVPTLQGYLDSPFNYRRLVEVIVSRSYTYGIFFPINRFLNDTLVILIAISLTVVSLVFSGKWRKFIVFGLFTIFASTFLFITKRTGVSDLYSGYVSSGPDQFFYAQNWVLGFTISLVIVYLVGKLKSRYRSIAYVGLIGIIVFIMAPNAGTYGKNDSMASSVGNVYEVSKKTCETNKAATLSIPIYPTSDIQFDNISKNQLCTKTVLAYYPSELDLGLKPYNNQYLDGLGIKNKFTQSFISPHDNLEGISVYFSTFLSTPRSPYTLNLFKGDCKTKITSIPIRTSRIQDNNLHPIEFPVIQDSENKEYCFSIISNRQDKVDPLAVQLSQPDTYPEGRTIVNGTSNSQDIVFELNYK